MLTIANFLSFLRFPLAFLFLSDSAALRIWAILLAMITDAFDGYLARKWNGTSRFGVIFDPAMDKFFVFFAIGTLLQENRLELWEACAMLSRDFFLCILAIYLSISKLWSGYKCKSVRWGKVTTAFQFIILIALTLGLNVGWYFYALFIVFGALAFMELIVMRKDKKATA